jgi:hypothetical protein
MAPAAGTMCRKAQLTINACPMTTFISIMEGHYWPRQGSFKVEKSVDDHVDIIAVTVNITIEKRDFQWVYCPATASKSGVTSTRKISFTRFWKWDDDGIYLITLSTVANENTSEESNNTDTTKTDNSPDPSIVIIITVSPRQEHANFDDDLSSTLVSCVVQVSRMGNWKLEEVDAFINDFLRQQLLDLRQSLMCSKFGYVYNSALSFAMTSHPVPISTNGAHPLPHSSSGVPPLRRAVSLNIDSEVFKSSGLPMASSEK